MSFAAVVAGGVALTTSIVGSAEKSRLANKQKKEAAKLRQSNEFIKANPINQVYNENKDIAQTRVTNGLAGKDLINQRLLEQNANAFNKSKLATKNSGDLLSAISAQNEGMNDKLLELGIADAEAKNKGLTDVQQQNLNIGAEKARLEAIAEQKRSNIRKQAGALEGAATENESSATQEMISGIGGAVNTAVGAISAKAQDKSDKEFWTNLLGKNSPPPNTKVETPTTKPIDNTPFVPNPNPLGVMTDEEKALLELEASSKKKADMIDAVENPLEKYTPLMPLAPLVKKKRKK